MQTRKIMKIAALLAAIACCQARFVISTPA
jgi:hypothetical protein